jgi:hypothetical protein
LFISSIVAAQPATQPAWREKFDAVYGLAPDEILKCVRGPFIGERSEFFADAMPEQVAIMGTEPITMTVVWGGSPRLDHCVFSGNGSSPSFSDTVASLTHLKPFELEIATDLAKQQVKGDWVLRKGADSSQLLESCAAIVGGESNQKISVVRETVEREAIIATGSCSDASKRQQPMILLPLNDLALCSPVIGNGTRAQFYDQLTIATGYPVIDENESDHRDGWFEWGVDGEYRPPAYVKDRVSSENLDALLKSISEQTSITFAIQPRKITRWRVTVEK